MNLQKLIPFALGLGLALGACGVEAPGHPSSPTGGAVETPGAPVGLVDPHADPAVGAVAAGSVEVGAPVTDIANGVEAAEPILDLQAWSGVDPQAAHPAPPTAAMMMHAPDRMPSRHDLEAWLNTPGTPARPTR